VAIDTPGLQAVDMDQDIPTILPPDDFRRRGAVGATKTFSHPQGHLRHGKRDPESVHKTSMLVETT
jgi:hypothetical protein